MILGAASWLYASLAIRRRQWYARDPARRLRLSRPVVSIGNLSIGGTGKTPTVEYVARFLVSAGERPAILTRGYARVRPADGVTVVSDGTTIRADFAAAGDEPLMLARALPGVPVLVGADRYLSGRFAEKRLGATVHLLDDGFQHVKLARDVDLLLVDRGDLLERVLPAGRLREPVAAASAADAVLVTAGDGEADGYFRRTIGVETMFRITRKLGTPRWVHTGEPAEISIGHAVVAVAGIARPERFFADLAATGWRVMDRIAFRDHHAFSRADVDRIQSVAVAAGATAILTTEKDAVRLRVQDLSTLPVAAVPLTVTVEPPDFVEWLLARVRAARTPVGLRNPAA